MQHHVDDVPHQRLVLALGDEPPSCKAQELHNLFPERWPVFEDDISLPDGQCHQHCNREYRRFRFHQLQGKLAITDPILNVFDGDDRYVCELPDCRRGTQ